MLEASKEERCITEICMRARLPVDRGKRMAHLLLKYGLLIELRESQGGRDRGRKYMITPRGYEWLGIYERLEEALSLGGGRLEPN